MEIPVCGMVLNRLPVDPDQAQKNAPHALAALASADLLAVFNSQPGTSREIVTQLAESLPNQQGYSWLCMKLGLNSR